MVIAAVLLCRRVARRCGRRFGVIAAVAITVAACAGGDDAQPTGSTRSEPEPEPQATTQSTAAGSTTTSTTTATTDTTTTTPSTTEASTGSEATEVPGDWADQIIVAFDTYVRTRRLLTDETFRYLNETQPETDQEYDDAFAAMYEGWADAGYVLTVSMPAAVPPDVAPAVDATLEAQVALVDQLRAASDGLLVGNPEPANERLPLLAAFNAACADLQFTLLDLGAGRLACGIDGENPEVREFVERATSDSSSAFVELPAGEYELDYIISNRVDNPNSDMVIGLGYEQNRLIRTSIEVLEVADTEDGPSIRLFANELVADPTDLAPNRIRNFWYNNEGPEDWIGALAGVTTVETGEGEISGIPAEYWVLVSELDAPIAILGDGPDWVPETTLDPGQPVRLWSVILDGHPLILTEHVPNGAALDEFTDELASLRAGLTLSID